MPLVAAEQNQMATTEAARLAYLSLHTGDPSTTGANEASGGSYARQALNTAWGTASGGSISAAQQSFSVNAATYTHFGFWTASTAGTFLGGNALAAQQQLTSAGVVKVTATLNVTVS